MTYIICLCNWYRATWNRESIKLKYRTNNRALQQWCVGTFYGKPDTAVPTDVM